MTTLVAELRPMFGEASTSLVADLGVLRDRHDLMPRDLIRIVEDLRVRARAMGNGFHPADLLRFSFLRTRHPQLFAALLRPACLWEVLESHLAWTQPGVERFGELLFARDEDVAGRRERTLETVDALLTDRSPVEQLALRRTLGEMFPQVWRALSDADDEPPTDDSPLLEEWRLAHPDVWPFYVGAMQPPPPYRGPDVTALSAVAATGSPQECATFLRKQLTELGAHPGWRYAYLQRLLVLAQSSHELTVAQGRTIVLALDSMMDVLHDQAWGRNPFLQERGVMADLAWRVLLRVSDDSTYLAEYRTLFSQVTSWHVADRLSSYALHPADFERSMGRPFVSALPSAAVDGYLAFFARWAWRIGEPVDIFNGGDDMTAGFQTLGRLAFIAQRLPKLDSVTDKQREGALIARDTYLKAFVASFPATAEALRRAYDELRESPTWRGDSDVRLVYGAYAENIAGVDPAGGHNA